MDEPALAQRMRASALSRHRSWDAVAQQTLSFYATLIAAKTRKGAA
jgi:hypothetical protein